MALGLRGYEADLCSGCGLPMTITLHPEAEGKIGAPLPQRCHSCTSLAKRQKDYRETEHPHALKYHAVPYIGLQDHIRRVDGITEPSGPEHQ